MVTTDHSEGIDLRNAIVGGEYLYETTVNSPELTGLSIGILVFGLILVLIMMISYWKVFIKAKFLLWIPVK